MLFRPRFRLAYSCCLAIAAFVIGAALGVAKPAAATSHEFQALGLQPPKEVVEAPDFTLKELNGKKVQLRDFRGKVVFLKFEIQHPKSQMVKFAIGYSKFAIRNLKRIVPDACS